MLDDLVTVTSQVKETGRSRLNVQQAVLRGEEVLVEGEVHLVCVDVKTFKPVSVPDALRKHWD